MPSHSGTVLVVDDDAAVRNSLKFALELEGLTVRAFAGAADLLAATDLDLGAVWWSTTTCRLWTGWTWSSCCVGARSSSRPS